MHSLGEPIHLDKAPIPVVESINSKFNIKSSPHLESICDSFDGILLDAYGVFWGGNDIGLLPGCRETMERLVCHNKVVGILSNSTQLATSEVEKLKKQGIIQGKHFHFLITSGTVARQIFLDESLSLPTPNKKFYSFGSPHPRFSSQKAIFQDTPFQETSDIDQADFIYISIPHVDGEDQTDPLLFANEVTRFKNSKVPMLCVNPDLFAHEGNPPRAVVRQGSIAAMHERQGGKVIYIGKPSEKMYTAAMKSFMKFGISNPKKIVMVGDTPETDIRGARNFGMPSALVLRTGTMADRIADQGFEYTLRTLSINDFPDFFIEYMGNK